MIELVREGRLTPSAESVARRAQVGPRTVFRHFKDMDSLHEEISSYVHSQLQDLQDVPLGGDTPAERVERLLSRRAELFERIMPFKIAEQANRHRSPYLQRANQRFVRRMRDMLVGVLPEEVVADADRFEAIDVMLSFEAWRRLREDHGKSREQALDIWRKAMARLLG